MTPHASIIIVTYGQRALTEQCLRSLQRCLGDRLGTDWELVLVDNNSPDDTPELLRSWGDRAHVVLLPENRNFAGGCNVGAAAASGDVLVFLNNDTEVVPGAIEAIVEQALEPGVSVAGCRLLFPDGTLQHAGVAFVRNAALGGAAMPQHVFHHQSQELPASMSSYEADCVTAACMAVRASTFHTVEGFDESFVNGLEDVDLCLRIRLTGERVVYRGDVTIVHHEGASRGQGAELWATPDRLQTMAHNDRLFVSRWAAHLSQDDELATQVWDAVMEDRPLDRVHADADVVVAGQPGGMGPAADEARALLAVLTANGIVPAAIDHPRPIVVPRLDAAAAALVRAAQQHIPRPGAPWVVVPSGEHDCLAVDAPAIVRLGRARTATPLAMARAVWASSPAIAAALVAGGADAQRVAVVAPPVLPGPLGEGGNGVLALLPAHIPALVTSVVAALRRLPASVPVRLLPTVKIRGLDRELADVLPNAQVLAIASDEARFARLCADADVVVAVDDDPFQRRALVAAGAGAAALTTVRDGPAAAVLGDESVVTEDGLSTAVLRHLEAAPAGRVARGTTVADACGPRQLAQRLDEVRPGLASLA